MSAAWTAPVGEPVTDHAAAAVGGALVIGIVASANTRWEPLSAPQRQALERDVAEAFRQGLGCASRAYFCAPPERCSAVEAPELRLSLGQPYVGELQHGFSLTLSGDPRSADFGKVVLLPLHCQYHAANAGGEPAVTVELPVSPSLQQADAPLGTRYLARQLYSACASAVPESALLALPSEAAAGATAATDETGGLDPPNQPSANTAAEAPDHGRPRVYENAESTVTYQFGNQGQNR